MELNRETSLLRQLADGNSKAFETLYYMYRSKVFGGILKLVKSPEVAEDLLQDVFVKVWNNRDRVNLGKSFKSYLYAITQSTVYDHFRKIASDQNKIENLINTAAPKKSVVEEDLAYKEMEGHLRGILEAMPEKCREVYILCKLEGRSYEEVSKLLNISTATINNHIVKASKIVKSNWNWV